MKYTEISKYWKEAYSLRKHMLYFFIALLVLSMFGAIFSGLFMDYQQLIIEFLSEELLDKNMYQLIEFIFLHNAQTNLMIILLAPTIILPLIILFANGFILGAISKKAVEFAGASQLLLLVPHGIFEIPAIMLSFAISYQIFYNSYVKKKNLFKEYKKGLLIYLFVIIPLLIIAAVIEGMLITIF